MITEEQAFKICKNIGIYLAKAAIYEQRKINLASKKPRFYSVYKLDGNRRLFCVSGSRKKNTSEDGNHLRGSFDR